MRTYGKRLRFLVLLMAAAAFSCARVAVKPKAIPPPEIGQLSGILVAAGVAIPLAGAVVEAGGIRTEVRADNTFALSGIAQGKQHVVVEKRFPEGPVRRVLGISPVFVAGSPVRLTIEVRDATDVDAFCTECHPPLKQVTRRDQKPRDIHISGIVPVIAGKDPALLDERGRVTCESCHTAHRAGEFPFFGVGDIKSGHFCNRCHRSR